MLILLSQNEQRISELDLQKHIFPSGSSPTKSTCPWMQRHYVNYYKGEQLVWNKPMWNSLNTPRVHYNWIIHVYVVVQFVLMCGYFELKRICACFTILFVYIHTVVQPTTVLYSYQSRASSYLVVFLYVQWFDVRVWNCWPSLCP